MPLQRNRGENNHHKGGSFGNLNEFEQAMAKQQQQSSSRHGGAKSSSRSILNMKKNSIGEKVNLKQQ